MKRMVAVFLGIIMVFALCACGEVAASHPTGEELNSLLSAMGNQVIETDTTLPEMIIDTSADENAEVAFAAVCDVDYNRVAGYFHAYASDGTAGEITIICANSSDDVVAIMNSLKSHVELRRGTMQNYSPDQVVIVDNATLTSSGCYVALFISEKSGLDKSTFNSELEDNGIQ